VRRVEVTLGDVRSVVDLRFNYGLFLFIPVPASARSPPYSRRTLAAPTRARPDTVPPPRISSPWRLGLFCITFTVRPSPSALPLDTRPAPLRTARSRSAWLDLVPSALRHAMSSSTSTWSRAPLHVRLVPCFHYRSCPPPPDLSLSSLSLCLICTSVGPRFPEYCAFVRVHRSTCSSCLPLSPSVVLRFHVSRTWYMVSYIACVAIYLVPQSEYRLGSPPSVLFPFLRRPPRYLGSPRPSLAPALPSRLRVW
jgi:hypothetical protein